MRSVMASKPLLGFVLMALLVAAQGDSNHKPARTLQSSPAYLAPGNNTQMSTDMTATLAAGQTSTLTVQMQIFGSSILPFTSTNQGIITQGMANFLNNGVTASQIILTVQNTIAAVSAPTSS